LRVFVLKGVTDSVMDFSTNTLSVHYR